MREYNVLLRDPWDRRSRCQKLLDRYLGYFLAVVVGYLLAIAQRVLGEIP
jgi:hypothetical protein